MGTPSEPAAIQLEVGTADLVRGTVTRADGGTVRLTTRECDLLVYFVRHPSRTMTRDELLAHVWGYRDTVVSRACDNTVRRLREKIEVDPAHPVHVLTAHGSGYRFEPQGAERAPPPPDEAPEAGGLPLGERTLDLARRRVIGPDGVVELTATEAALIERLLRA